jgi:hypothetical protein
MHVLEKFISSIRLSIIEGYVVVYRCSICLSVKPNLPSLIYVLQRPVQAIHVGPVHIGSILAAAR